MNGEKLQLNENIIAENIDTDHQLISPRKIIYNNPQIQMKNELEAPPVDQVKKQNSFIDFMQNFEEFKDNKKLDLLKKEQVVKKSKTILFNDLDEIEDEVEEKPKPPKSCYKQVEIRMRKIILSPLFSFFATFAIVIILFIDDIKIIAINKRYDTAMDILTLTIISFIFIEISLFIIFIRSYKFSFFFWLDICSFCSLIPDLLNMFVSDENMDYANSGNGSSVISLFLGNTQLSKTSRASVAGTKAGRLISILRSFKMLSVINVGKAYKHTVEKILKKSESLFFKDKLKEMIKLSRRKNVNLISTKDKMFFFKHIHNVLNNPDIFQTISQSKINKDVIKNYYNYAMQNEKKLSLEKGQESQKSSYNTNVTNINININLIQNSVYNQTSDRKNITKNKYKTLQHVKASNKEEEQISHLLNFIHNDSERSDLIKTEKSRRRTTNDKNRPVNKKNTFLMLMKNSDKAVNYLSPKLKPNKTIKENIDGEDEISVKDNKSNHKSDFNNEPMMMLNENKHLSQKLSLFEKKRSRILSKKKFSMDELSKDYKFCTCKESVKSVNKIFTLRSSNVLNNLAKKDNELSFVKQSDNMIGNSANIYQHNEIIKVHRKATSTNHNDYLKNDDQFCHKCGGLVLPKNEKEHKKIEQFKTYLEHNHSISSGSSKSSYEKINGKVHKDNKIEIHENRGRISRRFTKQNTRRASIIYSSEESENEEKVNFDNLPELKIRYLTFDRMKTPKLALTLSKKTTIKVIFIILSLLFSDPFLTTDNYLNNYMDQFNFEINLMDQYLVYNRTDIFLQLYNTYITNLTNFNSNENNAFYAIGFNSLQGFCGVFPSNCTNISSVNLTSDGTVLTYLNNDMYLNARKTQSAYVEYTYLYAIYDVSWFIKLGSILNICKIFFVAFMLWLGSFIFLKDVYKVVVKPLEFISKKITIQQNNIEKLCQGTDDKKIEDLEHSKSIEDEQQLHKFGKNMETIYIQKFVQKNAILLMKTLGVRTFNYLNYKVLSQELELLERLKPDPFSSFNAIIMVIKIKGFDKLLLNYQENVMEVLYTILNIIDLTLFENFGEIISINQDTIVVLFDESKYIKNNSTQEKSISISKEEGSFMLDKRELQEEYHSFESKSKNSSINSSLMMSEQSENSDVLLVNNEVKNMNTFALISALKIFARTRYNTLLEEKLKSKCLSFQDIYMHISLDTGNVMQHILNTESKVETIYTAKELKRCLFLNKLMDNYGIRLCCSGRFIDGIENMRHSFREIDTLKESTISAKSISLYTFDIVLEENVYAKKYMEKLVFDKHTSCKVRSEHMKFINENNFDFNLYFKMDPEIVFIRPKNLNTFVKYYKHGYKLYKNGKIKKGFDILKYALSLQSCDTRTKQLFNLLKNRIKEQDEHQKH